ncbi:hypothetical protein NFI96_002897 [Prochilodus magdalenae]|nr:hypothetical protein NFI96_002897 [Prochilodus magdalenae]
MERKEKKKKKNTRENGGEEREKSRWGKTKQNEKQRKKEAHRKKEKERHQKGKIEAKEDRKRGREREGQCDRDKEEKRKKQSKEKKEELGKKKGERAEGTIGQSGHQKRDREAVEERKREGTKGEQKDKRRRKRRMAHDGAAEGQMALSFVGRADGRGGCCSFLTPRFISHGPPPSAQFEIECISAHGPLPGRVRLGGYAAYRYAQPATATAAAYSDSPTVCITDAARSSVGPIWAAAGRGKWSGKRTGLPAPTKPCSPAPAPALACRPLNIYDMKEMSVRAAEQSIQPSICAVTPVASIVQGMRAGRIGFRIAEAIPSCCSWLMAVGELEHPHTVPADGAVGVEVEGHQAFWTCDDKPFILVLTTVPPHTESLGVSTKTKAGLVTEDDPLPF